MSEEVSSVVTESALDDPPFKNWDIGSLVSLLDSTREEVRAHRSQLYGAVTAAFLLPVATIAAQATHFLWDYHGLWGKVAFGLWCIGLIFLGVGLWWIRPKGTVWNLLKMKGTESEILTLSQSALRGREKQNLAECIDAECDLLRRVFAASGFFSWALFSFILSAGTEFWGFVSCIFLHGGQK